MTDEQIDMEEVANINLDKSISKMKAIQSRKRMALLKRLENTFSQEDLSRGSRALEGEQGRNSPNQSVQVGSGRQTLGVLYLLSSIIFVILSAVFGFKLWLRLDFKKFAFYSLDGET